MSGRGSHSRMLLRVASSSLIEARVRVPFPANGFTSTLSSLYAARVIAMFASRYGFSMRNSSGLTHSRSMTGSMKLSSSDGAKHHHERDYGKSDAILPDIAEAQRRRDDRERHQHPQTGRPQHVIDVAHPVDDAVGMIEEPEAREPIAVRALDEKESQDDRNMRRGAGS